MSRKELRIAGFGGQGVVLAGHIVGQAASVYDKGFATFTQSYGPEARGGSCTAEVIVSDESISYPYLNNPQVLVIISQESYAKYGQDVTPGTLLIIDPDLVKPDTGKNKVKFLSIPANRLAREQIGRVVVANIILLGFLAAVSDIVSPEALKASILASVPKGTGDLNMKAFDLGYHYGLEHGSVNSND
ncbi:MAG: 2-oxoacid:acceptor oxidoreductase family protein [Chloroflexota bacterium]